MLNSCPFLIKSSFSFDISDFLAKSLFAFSYRSFKSFSCSFALNKSPALPDFERTFSFAFSILEDIFSKDVFSSPVRATEESLAFSSPTASSPTSPDFSAPINILLLKASAPIPKRVVPISLGTDTLSPVSILVRVTLSVESDFKNCLSRQKFLLAFSKYILPPIGLPSNGAYLILIFALTDFCFVFVP